MRINHNLMAMNTYRQLGINQASGQKSLEKLSSGLRINRAGDDAAGLAISEKMRGQIRGLNQASRNAQDGISLIQSAEGALQETHSILQRMRELAVQAANSTNEEVDRKEIQNEINQLTSEINRIANTTEFNKKSLLNGDIAITGDGRAVASGADYGTGMSILDIISNSLLGVGDYEIAVTNETQNLVANGQSGSLDDASVVQEAVELGEGSYRVNVEHQSGAKTIASTTDTNSLLESSGVNIYSGSALENGEHTIDVTMNTERTVTNIDSGGISNIDADSTVVGNYTISTKANLTASGAVDETSGLVANEELYKADNSGAIKNITISKDSILSSTDNLQISVEQMTSVADSFSTAHLVEQGLIFEARDADVAGQDLSIKFVAEASQTTTEVTVTDGDIEVKLATDASSNVSATLADIKTALENSAAAGIITVNYDVGYTGDETAEATDGTEALKFIDGSSEDATTFKFTLENDNEVFGQATATFSNSSGATTIKLGDVSFTVDNSDMFNGDTAFDAQKITLAVNNAIRVTDSDGNYAEVPQGDDIDNADVTAVTFSTWLDKDGKSTSIANSIKMDIDTNDIGDGGFIRGNSYYINVDSTDNYTVLLKNESDEAVGEAYTFTREELVDSSTYTNVGLGEMNSGLYVDFDKEALAALESGIAKSITINIGTTDAYVAQLQAADGTAIGQTITLKEDAGQSANLGEGIVFEYSNDGTQLDGGGQHYFSVKSGQDNFEMFLSGNDIQIGEKVAFEKGDTVSFGDTGLSIKTDDTIIDGEETTFTIEDTTVDNSLALQIGANYGQSMNIDINDMSAEAIKISAGQDNATYTSKSGAAASFTEAKSVTDGINNEGAEYALDISDHGKASAAIDVINDAIESVSAERSKLGAFQNRLEHTISNLGTSAENLQAAESRIRDVDMAQEMMEFTKNNILQQAAQAMLAQANQAPQGVLQLLR